MTLDQWSAVWRRQRLRLSQGHLCPLFLLIRAGFKLHRCPQNIGIAVLCLLPAGLKTANPSCRMTSSDGVEMRPRVSSLSAAGALPKSGAGRRVEDGAVLGLHRASVQGRVPLQCGDDVLRHVSERISTSSP